jgi:hypothetical protein
MYSPPPETPLKGATNPAGDNGVNEMMNDECGMMNERLF